MASLETGYQPLCSYSDVEDNPEHTIHYTESRKGQWQMKDLDSFFTRIYEFHQYGGFWTLFSSQFLGVLTNIYYLLLVIVLVCCINYPALFKQERTKDDQAATHWIFYSADECLARIGTWTIVFLVCSLLIILFRLYQFFHCVSQISEMKEFYTTVLNISPTELENLTWYDVQKILLEVQKEEHVCVHKRDLTELDIYHRILRKKNYMVAMVNKNVIPLKLRMPFVGEVPYLPKTLLFNLEVILFRSPWAPFDEWQLRQEFKSVANRDKLRRRLERQFTIAAVINLVFFPLILLGICIRFFVTYGPNIKQEPSFFTFRRWSQYARLYLRHFNELDHELNARLCRAYKPAKQYVEMFSSKLLTVFVGFFRLWIGTLITIVVILSMYENSVLQVEYVVTFLALSGLLYSGLSSMIPDPNLVFRPKQLMRNIIAHVHYIPDHWRGNEHTNRTRSEFTALFQYRVTYVIEEMLSAILTPAMLYYCIRPKSQDIVDFLRNFTVEVTGVGDVCSFALMDIRNHGNPKWLSEGCTEADQYHQAEQGKTELSLIHFTCTNPEWTPPNDANNYLRKLREQVQKDAIAISSMPGQENALTFSLYSLPSLGPQYADLIGTADASVYAMSSRQSRASQGIVFRNVAHNDGPIYHSLGGDVGACLGLQSLANSWNNTSAQSCDVGAATDHYLHEFGSTRMALSTLYLHGVQEYQRDRTNPEEPIVTSHCTSSGRGREHQHSAHQPTQVELNMTVLSSQGS